MDGTYIPLYGMITKSLSYACGIIILLGLLYISYKVIWWMIYKWIKTKEIEEKSHTYKVLCVYIAAGVLGDLFAVVVRWVFQ